MNQLATKSSNGFMKSTVFNILIELSDSNQKKNNINNNTLSRDICSDYFL